MGLILYNLFFKKKQQQQQQQNLVQQMRDYLKYKKIWIKFKFKNKNPTTLLQGQGLLLLLLQRLPLYPLAGYFLKIIMLLNWFYNYLIIPTENYLKTQYPKNLELISEVKTQNFRTLGEVERTNNFIYYQLEKVLKTPYFRYFKVLWDNLCFWIQVNLWDNFIFVGRFR